jgi:hypothetical protein
MLVTPAFQSTNVSKHGRHGWLCSPVRAGCVLRRHFESDVEAAPVDERRVTARLEKAKNRFPNGENSIRDLANSTRAIDCDKH